MKNGIVEVSCMIEIFLCDDDRSITDYLHFFIMKHYNGEMQATSFNRCADLFGMIEINGRIPDILIMDVNLKDGNGIQTVKRIQAAHPGIKVIYLTGILQYATEIFQTDPIYFLTKPINENKLADAIEKAKKALESDRSDSMVIKTNGSEVLIYRKEIVFVESRGRKLIFYMNNGDELCVYEKMDVMQNQLGFNFVRSHKSFLINMKYIVERNNQEFSLADGRVLPISKPNLREAKMRFISYLGDSL